MDPARLVFGIVVVLALIAVAVATVKSLFGKPFRGTLSVPQGKTRLKIDVFDDRGLRPLRYNQLYEAILDAGEHTLEHICTHESRTDTGVILFNGKPVGFVDKSDPFGKALMLLAAKNNKLVVPMTIMGTDANNLARIELELPDASWFRNALKKRKREWRMD